MANPFLVLGGIAVGVITAAFGIAQVPGWVANAQNAAAINDLGNLSITEGVASSKGLGYLNGAQLAKSEDKLGMSFALSGGVEMCVTAAPDGSGYAAVARSASGAYFARLHNTTRPVEAQTAQAAIDAVGTLAPGVPSPVTGDKCAPGAGVGESSEAENGGGGSEPEVIDTSLRMGWASHNLTTLAEEEALFGVTNSMVSTYVDFVNSPDFPDAYANAARNRDASLLIAWEPWDWNAPIGEQPQFAPRSIAAGTQDTHIISWLKDAQTYADDVDITVRFAPEMNDISRPWSSGIPTVGYDTTTPAEYIAMWRHVYQLKQTHAPDVDFMWNPLNYGAGEHQFEAFFPGDEYVDSLGLNGFNWSDAHSASAGWQNSGDVFGFGDTANGPVHRLKTLAGGKPWGIAEAASAPDNPADFQPGGKYYDAWGSWVFEWPENPPYEATAEDWITQEGWSAMLLKRSYDEGAAFVNFFHTIKETDWRLTDTERGRAVLQDAAKWNQQR